LPSQHPVHGFEVHFSPWAQFHRARTGPLNDMLRVVMGNDLASETDKNWAQLSYSSATATWTHWELRALYDVTKGRRRRWPDVFLAPSRSRSLPDAITLNWQTLRAQIFLRPHLPPADPSWCYPHLPNRPFIHLNMTFTLGAEGSTPFACKLTAGTDPIPLTEPLP
jgi:hypothetical protein